MTKRFSGTTSPMNKAGFKRVCLALVVLLLSATLMVGAVSAEDTAVAKHTLNGVDSFYPSLVEAVAAATDSTNKSKVSTVTLLKPSSGSGVIVPEGTKDLTIDLGGFIYTANKLTLAGSDGTETQAFQLLKNSNVTIRNGEIGADLVYKDDAPTELAEIQVRMLVQNYCNLTLDNVILNGTKLDGDNRYTLSNNCGFTVLKNHAKVIAKEGDGHYAFDVYRMPGYTGVSVTIATDDVVIDGAVEFDGRDGNNPRDPFTFTVPKGYLVDVDLLLNESSTYTAYYWKVADATMTFAGGNPLGTDPLPECLNNALMSSDKTVTLLRDIVLDEPVTINKAITFDGQYKQITAAKTLTGGHVLSVESVTEDKEVILTQLNMKAEAGATALSGNLGFITIKDKTTLKDSTIDLSGYTQNGNTMVPSVYIYTHDADGSIVDNCTIKNANNVGTSSTRGIVLDTVSDVVVEDNTITLGTSKVDDSTLSTSFAVQIKGTFPITDITVKNNMFIAGAAGKALYSGVEINSVGSTSDSTENNYTITGNVYQNMLKNENYAALTIIVGFPQDGKKENAINLTVTGNRIDGEGLGYGVWVKNAPNTDAPGKVYKGYLTGTVKGNDFNNAQKVLSVLYIYGSTPDAPKETSTTKAIVYDTVDWGVTAKADIVISGDISLEKAASETQTGTLSAALSDSTGASFTWKSDDLTLNAETGSSVTYTVPAAAGTYTVKVTSEKANPKEVIITVYEKLVPDVPNDLGTGLTVTSDEPGVVNMVPDTNVGITSQTNTETGETTYTATVNSGSQDIQLTVGFINPTVQRNDAGTITGVYGAVGSITAVYAPQAALAEDGTVENLKDAPVSQSIPVPMKYALVISQDPQDALPAGAQTFILPTISPDFDEAIAEKVTDKYADFTPLAMITASGNLDAINPNITENGIVITFFIPKEGKYQSSLYVSALHVKQNQQPKVLDNDKVVVSTFVDENDNNKEYWLVNIFASEFSSYVLVETPAPVVSQPPKQETSQGTSEWLTETPTQQPTATPTPTQTAQPTDTVPTDIPTTSKPTEEPSSPGFGILAALAGLGAVAVLRRK